MTTTREDAIRRIQDHCADLLERDWAWTEEDAREVAEMFVATGDPWGLFIYMDERTGAWDVGYRTRDGREWFPILRQMRNGSSVLLRSLGSYDMTARMRVLS
jgi:hypothetical protein